MNWRKKFDPVVRYWKRKVYPVIRYRSYLLFLPLLIAHELAHLSLALLFMPANTSIQFDFYSHDYLLVTEVRPGAGYKIWQSLIIAAAPVFINLGCFYMAIECLLQAISLSWGWGYMWFVYFIWASVLCGISRQDVKAIQLLIKLVRHGNNKADSKSPGPGYQE